MLLKWKLFLLVIALPLLVLAACADDEVDWTSQPDESGAMETEESEPSPTPTPAIPEDDPRDLAVEIAKAGASEDYEFIYDHLTERFQAIEFGEQWVRVLGLDARLVEHFSGESLSVDAMEVEIYRDLAIVWLPETPVARYVFQAESGEWRLEPGDHMLSQAARIAFREEQDRPAIIDASDGVEISWDFEGSGEIVPPPARFIPWTVAMHDDSVDVTVNWELSPVRGGGSGTDQFDEHLRHSTEVPLDGVRWQAGGESGPVEVVWTNANVDEEQLRLPGWGALDMEELGDGEQEMLPRISSYTTFRLDGLPGDIDEITLQVDEVMVGPLGEGAPVGDSEPLPVSLEATFPAETTTEILDGDVPDDTQAGDVESTPEPVPHDELPPAPSIENMSVTDVEYAPSDGGMEATIDLDTDGALMELPGETVVEWSDGETSYPSIETNADRLRLIAEREETADDVEVSTVRFDAIARQLESDPDATLSEDAIETEWGDFQILEMVERGNGGTEIHYQPAGRRYINGLQLDHDGERIGLAGSGTRFDEDLRPVEASLTASEAFQSARDALPLPVEVEVWQMEQGLVIEVND